MVRNIDWAMNNIAIIVAAGSGSRAQSAVPKQFQKLGRRTILEWSARYFVDDERFSKVIIVHAKNAFEYIDKSDFEIGKFIFCLGGETRTQSTIAGLKAAKDFNPSRVFIHDAARPGINRHIIDRIFAALDNGADGALPVLQISDAIWQLSPENQIKKPVPRDNIRRVQTPQAFDFAKLNTAYASIGANQSFNDDAEVAIASGMIIEAIEGDIRLDKITFKEDFERMENILSPKTLRVGSGFDAHKFGDGNFVTLCGEKIAHTHGLLGHSDADVAWHALVDAILGALGEGDIGSTFPPSDIKWKGAASSVFLEYAIDRVKQRGGTINHLDITIICEAPKIGPVRDKLIENTCRIANLDRQSVSIKATTTEAMGFTGRKEGIAAQAIATINV